MKVNLLLLIGNPFRVLHEIVDLGVTIDIKLKFNIYIDEVICNAKRRIYLLFKSFTSGNVSLFIINFLRTKLMCCQSLTIFHPFGHLTAS